MLRFKTPSPNYHGGVKRRNQSPSYDLCSWLSSLIRTPTPTYSRYSDDSENDRPHGKVELSSHSTD